MNGSHPVSKYFIGVSKFQQLRDVTVQVATVRVFKVIPLDWLRRNPASLIDGAIGTSVDALIVS